MFSKILAGLMVDLPTPQIELHKKDRVRERFCSLTFGIFVFGIALPLIGSCSAELGPADSGLIGYWKFEEGSGNAVKDSSVNGNDGTIVPANVPEPKWGTGKFAGS